ncbi:hypothetical protein NM208_g13732 [Fusarium decemcellulare]|uniref:Uncharacterized protein n=1 Tax=Fusarium decemcellulare TaxID=57161 RepID=A0ACC1RKL6_9HYPO|nr:hypothetical protein NM208_g13732 [Fusarium decemcellulare]
MAGLVDTLVQLPQTPPQTAVESSNMFAPGNFGRSPGKSPADSGVYDLFGDPTKTPSRSPRGKGDEVQDDTDEGDRFWESAQSLSAQKASARRTRTKAPLNQSAADTGAMPEDPFDNQHNRILFNAIDKLRSVGSQGLKNIPQLVIVGGQSSGKSSLLQSLTGIPFPVNSGCCTRWPTRIVSRRTEPGSKDAFRITIEKSDVDVPGMSPTDEPIEEYLVEGDVLTKEKFVETVDTVSSDWMGISIGTGKFCRNFASEVLKIELSGPNRSHFSILDLPGTFQNSSKVNKEDRFQVETMIVEYMKKLDSIVICVLDAPTDFDRQEVYSLACDWVEPNRLVGVFTKCDMIENEPEAAKRVVSIATNGSLGNHGSVHKGWFLVRNRADKDGESFDLKAAEQSLFDTAPWKLVPPERLGSTALKTHLGEVLSSRIRDCFPDLRGGIESKLNEKLAEKESLGDPRDSYAAKRDYAYKIVSDFEEMADKALDRPEDLPEGVTPLLWEVSKLNNEFDKFMRAKGAVWEFEDPNIDPYTKMAELTNPGANLPLPGPTTSQKETAGFDKKFPNCSEIRDSGDLMKTIEKELATCQAAQLPGIVHPVVYTGMYRKQVHKWQTISQRHMFRVAEKVQQCYMSIMNRVCPSDGDNRIRQELEDHLHDCYNKTAAIVDGNLLLACKEDTDCKILQMTDPEFGRKVLGWRQLRFMEATVRAHGIWGQDTTRLADFVKYFNVVHPSLERNMVQDVHDVLKVYYEKTLGVFIQNITRTLTNQFVRNDQGPMKGLNTKLILGLNEERLDSLCRENEDTIKRRADLTKEIESLQGALAIVEKARRQTAELERY